MSGGYDRPLTPEEIAAVRDESIDFSDIPELDEGFWERAELVESYVRQRTENSDDAGEGSRRS